MKLATILGASMALALGATAAQADNHKKKDMDEETTMQEDTMTEEAAPASSSEEAMSGPMTPPPASAAAKEYPVCGGEVQDNCINPRAARGNPR